MDEAGAREALLHLLHQDPTQYGQSQARWSLAGLMKATQDWLRLTTQAGMSQLLKRLKIVWKNARYHEHSPDPNYVDKLRTVKQQILAAPKQDQVVLFEDEFTLYRHPELGRAYEQQGKAQPLAELGYLGNYTYRIAAALNVWTGQVVYHAAWMLDITRMIRFYRKLTQTFPNQEILLIEDNWSIHYHPDLIAALQPQSLPYGTLGRLHYEERTL